MKVRMDILVHLNVPDEYDLDNIVEWFKDTWDKSDLLKLIDETAEYVILDDDDDEDCWEVIG